MPPQRTICVVDARLAIAPAARSRSRTSCAQESALEHGVIAKHA